MKKLHWTLQVLAIAICLFGLSLGMAFSATRTQTQPVVALEPQLVELVEEPFEHQKISVAFQLRNPTLSPIKVLKVSPSCGCMNVVTRGGQPMTAPLTLASGRQLPWQVELATEGRIGPQEYSLTLDCLVDDKPMQLTSKISFVVRSSWRADPPIVDIYNAEPGEELTREIGIYDAFGTRGFRVAKVETSNPARLTADLIPPEQGVESSPKILQFGAAQLDRRYRLSITMRAGELNEVTQYKVLLTSAEPDQPILEIPVICRVKPSPYEMIPNVLYLPASQADEPTRRTVRCVLHGVKGPLRVLRAPSHTEIDCHAVEDNTVEIDLVVKAKREPQNDEDTVTFAADGSDDPVCALVLKYRSEQP